MSSKLNCILMVDDDESCNYINKLVVREMEIADQVHVLNDPNLALDYLASCGNRIGVQAPGRANRYLPDLIFLDISMPTMDGWEFLQHYHQLAEEKDIPTTASPAIEKGNGPAKRRAPLVILLTSSQDPADEVRAKEFPSVVGLCQKPLVFDMLNEILHQHFGEEYVA